MLRVTIELVPFGDEAKKRKIGEMVIANTGKNPDGTFSYAAWTAKDQHSQESGLFGRLLSFDRRQSPWELIRLILEAIRLEKHIPDTRKNSVDQRLKHKISR